jgi:cation:H+ antiporter
MDLITLVLFVLGFVLLTVGADLLVRGASDLADTLGISRLVVGLTIVAFGTSAPELAVNLQSAWTGQPDIAVGNVVGSNILNILLVLGVAAVIAPLGVHKRLIQLEVPLMIGVSILLLLLSLDGTLSRWEGLLLTSGLVFYTIFALRKERQTGEPPLDAEKIPEESDKGSGSEKSGGQISESVGLVRRFLVPKLLSEKLYNILIQLIFIIVGLGLLVQGSQWLVDGAVSMAEYFGISKLIIGLTIISIGTSLPELATVVVGSLRGEQELVVGNVVGSNLFNILLVLGFTSLVLPLGVPPEAIVFHMPVMIAVAVACLPIFFTDYLIERWEGGLFLAYYVAYTLYLVLNASQHEALSTFSAVMLWFVIPITMVTLIGFVWQFLKKAPPTSNG